MAFHASAFQAGTPREASHVTRLERERPRGLSHERSRVGTPRKASHVSGLEAGPPCQASHTSSSRNIRHCDWASRPLLRPKTARYDAKIALTKVLPVCFGSMQLCRMPLAYRAWNARVHSRTEMRRYGQTGIRAYGHTDIRTSGQTNAETDGRTDIRTYGWTNQNSTLKRSVGAKAPTSLETSFQRSGASERSSSCFM